MPTHSDLVVDLRVVREKGLGQLRRYATPALFVACRLYGASTDETDRPRAVEALIKQAVLKLGGGRSGDAAEYTFGLVAGTRLWSSGERRKAAAKAQGVSVERFRKGYEGVLIEQVAEGVLALVYERAREPEHLDPDVDTSVLSENELNLARKLHRAGVSDFHLSRADYRFTLGQFLERAHSSITLISMSLKTKGAENEIAQVFKRFLAERPQFRIIVSLIKPDSLACEAAAQILGIPCRTLRAEIESMLSDLHQLKHGLSAHQASRLYLLQHVVIPSFSCILLDDGLPTAQLQMEAKPYGAPRSDSYGFTLLPNGALYERHRLAYYKILRDAVPFPDGDERPFLPLEP